MLPMDFRGAKYVPSYVLAAWVSALGVASAQPVPDPSAAAAPAVGAADAPATQSPAAPPAVSVPPAAAGPLQAPLPDQPTAAPIEVAPATPPAPQVRYGRFGGDAEPAIEPGSWDPWASPVPGRFEHDGFFLRLNIGPGVANVSRPGYRWSGAALNRAIAIGGSVVENLALHADFHTTLLPNPTQRMGNAKQDFQADIVFESMGVGVTYHLMPVNLFVSASGGVGVLAFEDDLGDSKETGAGLMLSGMIGKEWWVGTDWGLGLAAHVQYTRVRDYLVDHARMNGLSVGLMFSATYN